MAQRFNSNLFIQSQLSMLFFPVFGLSGDGFNFSLQFPNVFVEILDVLFVAGSYIVEVSVEFGNVFIVLGFESVNGVEHFNLILPLDHKDLVLESLDMGFQIMLDTFIFFDLPLIAGKQEIDFCILLSNSLVKIFNFLHQGILDIQGKITNMRDPLLSFLYQQRPLSSQLLIIFHSGLGKFFLQLGKCFFESVDLIIFLTLYLIQFELQRFFSIFPTCNFKLSLSKFLLQLILPGSGL